MPDPADTDDLALLIDAARTAAEIALGYAGKAPQVWEKDDDAGPVTEADLAVDATLRQTLTAARPGYGWLSEETPDTPDRLSRDSVFIVDPIDGTRGFIDNKDNWGHSLALSRAGKVTAAVVFMPRRDKMYAASLGGRATLNGRPMHAATRDDPEGASLLAGRGAMDPRHWSGPPPTFDRHFRYPMAYRLACLAEGRFDALFSPSPIWEWDLAAGALLITESGHVITDPDGGPLGFNAPHPRASGALAANPLLHTALLSKRRTNSA